MPAAILRPAPAVGPCEILVIAPRAIIEDELRMLRLEEYLEAAFPGFRFLLSDENTLPNGQAAVGVMPGPDGANPLREMETRRVMREVGEAVQAFVEHRRYRN